jgi:hypothetical protein
MSASVVAALGAWVPREELERGIVDGLTPDRFEDYAWGYAGLLVENLEIDAADLDHACHLIWQGCEQIWDSRARVR